MLVYAINVIIDDYPLSEAQDDSESAIQRLPGVPRHASSSLSLSHDTATSAKENYGYAFAAAGFIPFWCRFEIVTFVCWFDVGVCQ